MARAYRELRTHGVDASTAAGSAEAVVAEARDPSTAPGVEVLAGQLTLRDLERLPGPKRKPVHSEYRGYDVYGMPVPSCGGIAVGEILNLSRPTTSARARRPAEVDNAQYLHRFTEATATAFADRNRYVGDVPGVPTDELVSQDFADERACLFDPDARRSRGRSRSAARTATTPSAARRPAGTGVPDDGQSRRPPRVADRWGNVVAYTLDDRAVPAARASPCPGYGFLLNNELTDFNFAPLCSRACPTRTCPARASARARR